VPRGGRKTSKKREREEKKRRGKYIRRAFGNSLFALQRRGGEKDGATEKGGGPPYAFPSLKKGREGKNGRKGGFSNTPHLPIKRVGEKKKGVSYEELLHLQLPISSPHERKKKKGKAHRQGPYSPHSVGARRRGRKVSEARFTPILLSQQKRGERGEGGEKKVFEKTSRPYSLILISYSSEGRKKEPL